MRANVFTMDADRVFWKRACSALAALALAFSLAFAHPILAFAMPEHWLEDSNGNRIGSAEMDADALSGTISYKRIVYRDGERGGWIFPKIVDLDTGVQLPCTFISSPPTTPLTDEVDKDGVPAVWLENALFSYSGFAPGHRYQVTFEFRPGTSNNTFRPGDEQYDYLTFSTASANPDPAPEPDPDPPVDPDPDPEPDPEPTPDPEPEPDLNPGSSTGSGTETEPVQGDQQATLSPSANSAVDAAVAASSAAVQSQQADAAAAQQTQDASAIDVSDQAGDGAAGGTRAALSAADLSKMGQLYALTTGDYSEGDSDVSGTEQLDAEIVGVPWLWAALWACVLGALPAGVAVRRARWGAGMRRGSRLRTR